MKLLLLLCSYTIAVATRRQWSEVHHDKICEQYYRPRCEYRYLYRGQLSTGLMQESDQHASTRFEAEVSLIFLNNEQTAILRLQQTRFGSLNGELPEPREVQRFEAFDQKEIEEDRLKTLRLPLRFRYIDGLVSEIEFDRNDKPWSENIKRAILNMLQVNIKKNVRRENREESRLQDDVQRWEETVGRDLKRENANFFTAYERTLEGDCETVYTFNKSPREVVERKMMRITKSINYEKCTKRVNLRYNHRFADACGNCEQKYEEEEGLMSNTVINYEILGDKDRFLIKNVDLKSQYFFALLGLKDTAITTFVAAQLQLLKVIENARNVEEPRSDRKETLIYAPKRVYKIERFFMHGDEELDRNHPYMEIRNKYELVEQMIRRQIRATSDNELGVESEAVHQLARLVDMLRACSKPEIQTIHRELFEDTGKFDKKTHQKVRDILVDALSLAATKNTIEHLTEKIQKGQVSILKASKALHNLVNAPVVSEKQIDMVFELCKKDVCERNPMLKQACLLTVGGMISALCTPNNDMHAVDFKEDRCPRQMKEKYFNEMMELYRNAENRYEKILALKTIGNAGIDLSVYELENIIMDRRQEKVIRVQAIDALRRLRYVMSHKIQKILLPIFKDKAEHPEIRITALVRIIQTLPQRSLLDQIAQGLFYETSRQVKTFTYTMLKTFATSQNPCEKKLAGFSAEDLQTALRLSRVETTRWSDSRFVHIPIYSEERKAGITFDFATIFSNDSIMPRESMFSLDTLLFGQWRKTTAQMGFIQYNSDQLIERWLRKTELEETVVRGRRTDPLRPAQILRTLFEKLQIRSRRERSQAYAMIYVRRGDLDYVLFPLDAETMPEMLMIESDRKIDFGRLIERLRRGYRFNTYFAHYTHETYHKIPTTIGIPLHYCSKMPTIAGIEGELRIVLEPQRSKRLRSIKLYINARPSVAATHVIDVYSINPITYQRPKMIQAIKVNLPIDARVETNFDRKTEIKWIMKIPEERKQIVSVKTRFVTSTSSWKRDTKTYIEPLDKTLHLKNHHQRLLTYDRVVGEKWMGMRIHIRGEWHENPLKAMQRSPVAMIAGESELEIAVEKGRDAPRDIVTKFEVELLKEDKMGRPQLEKFYLDESYERRGLMIEREKESNEEEEENDLEQKRDREERRRRQKFGRYMREYKPDNGYKLRIQMRIETVDTSSQRKVEMEVLTGCDEKVRYCMMDIEARRVPIFEDERREWTLKAKLESLYPEFVQSFKEVNKMKRREFNALIECEWGSEQRHHMNMQIHGEQSHEQTCFVESINNENRLVQRYEDMLLATQLNQFKIVVNYKVNQYFKNYFNWVFDMLKSWHLWNARIERVQNPEGKLFAKLTIDPYKRELLSVVLETPKEIVEIKDIVLPMKVAPFKVKVHKAWTPVRSFTEFIRKRISGYRAECTVSSRRVNTFDDVDIKMPLTTCYSVLAKDCRSEQPKFAVLMRKLRKNSEEKKMKIIDEEHVIELEPIRDDVKVKIDGQEVENDQHLSEMGTEKKDDIVTVELEDVVVRFDGRIASIKISPLFKNGQCGICGHYDGEKFDELRRANNELTDDVEHYLRSYFDRNEECDIEEDVVREKKNYRILDEIDEFLNEDKEEGEEEREIKKPTLRTKVVERDNRICFSMNPIPECLRRTYIRNERTTQSRVPFACIPRDRHEAVELLNKARYEVLNMNNYKMSFVDEVTIPESCRVF